MKNQLSTPKQKRTVLPAVALATVFLLMLSGAFALGFVAGNVTQPGSRQLNEPFERPLAREMQLPIEKMPEELP